MTFTIKLFFLSLFLLSVSFISRSWEMETNLLQGKSTTFAFQKIINLPASAPVGNVGVSLLDTKGNIWFATSGNGVYRYDGKSFTNFTSRYGLNSDMVLSMVEDKKGDLWFGTDAGVSHFDASLPDRQAKTFTDIPIPGKFVTSILEDKNGKLWFGTRDGVYIYDKTVFTRLLDNKNIINRNGLALRVVQRMLEDKQGNIWITTKDEGICRYDGKSIINYKPNDELWFRSLFKDKDGTIWAGGKNIVCRFDGKTFINMTQDGTFNSSTVYSITQDKSGNMWFGTEASDASDRETEGGVWVYNGASFKHFSKQDGLSHNAVWCILEDKTGKFWFGTRRGLSRYDGRNFTSSLE